MRTEERVAVGWECVGAREDIWRGAEDGREGTGK